MNFSTLAQRLGITAPASVLLRKLRRLQGEFPAGDTKGLETWLVELANARGFSAIQRRPMPLPAWIDETLVSNEELAVALMHPALADEPQVLRLAAQMISRGRLNPVALLRLAEMECGSRILLSLAQQALKASPSHKGWLQIADHLRNQVPLPENVIHWTRLAEPVMKPRGPHNGEWRLVA